MSAFPFDKLLDWPFLTFLIIVMVSFRFRNEISEQISSISELSFGERAKISIGARKSATEIVEVASSGEQAQTETQEFPADDIRLAYENLDWERHWPEFLSFALNQEGGGTRRQVYDALAELSGGQGSQLLDERPIAIDIEESSFNQLKSLKLIDLSIEEPSFIQNIGAAIAFLIPLYLGISLITSDSSLDLLTSVAPDWLGGWFVFVPLGLIFLFFFLLARVFRNVLEPDAPRKIATLTQSGEKFLRDEVKPILADYIRDSGL